MPVLSPPPQLIYAVNRVAPGVYGAFGQRLNRALAGLRFTTTAYYRDRSHNARVGGAASSQHLIGTAIDLVFRSSSERAAGIQRLRQQGLIAVDEGDHVHVQAWPADFAIRVIRAVGV